MRHQRKILPAKGVIGMTAYASLVLCIISGVLLAIPYDASKPYESIITMMMANMPAIFFRSVHYWSAQLTLILLFAHIIDHVIKRSPPELKRNVWIRLVITVIFVFFATLTGFFLRGDGESVQAVNVFKTVLNSIPILGRLAEYLIFGAAKSLQVVYIQHAATATIVIWLTTAEHSRKIFPPLKYIIYTAIAVSVLGWLIVPGLHNPSDTSIKGPWYFIGLQEILHWLSDPFWAVILAGSFILYLYLFRLPQFAESRSYRRAFYIAIALYLGLTIFAAAFRGENWELTVPWGSDLPRQSEFLNFNAYFPDRNIDRATFTGKKESCITCHKNTAGLSQSHSIEAVGCTSCHFGNPFTLNKTLAHEGISLTPGNLNIAARSCGMTDCHPGIVTRVSHSLMATMNGVVAVDKFVFGEAATPDGFYDIAEIGHSPAEEHLRNLCASCHLSKNKVLPGSVNELSRGGGCSACHLDYSGNAGAWIAKYHKGKSIDLNRTFHHPSIDINIGDDKCFGCHSRSGRISLNYQGWAETKLKPGEMEHGSNFRTLADGRTVVKRECDIHYERGIRCTDCHLSYEIMGDGGQHIHKEDQVKIACEDCHFTKRPETAPFDKLDPESQKILKLRNIPTDDRKFAKSAGGYYYTNFYEENGKFYFKPKFRDTILSPKPPSKACGINISGHKDMACKTCHTAWAPQCISCHTQYEPNAAGWDNLLDKPVKGCWVEYDGEFLAEQPVLGVWENSKGRQVTTFVPGMIMTIQSKSGSRRFSRLHAPAFPHTVTTKPSGCKSCHNNPLAIGYGRGKLELESGKESSNWELTSYYKASIYDGLPEDAWVGFMGSLTQSAATRRDCRPFDTAEQRKILAVGTCLSCHGESDAKIIKILTEDKDYMRKISPRCILPGNGTK